jgi:AcrR family transcriptional regulator
MTEAALTPPPPSDPASEPPSEPASEPAGVPGTRERLVRTMTGALRRRGLHGIGLTELLSRAGAPKGVLYHHFPGGKQELAVAAIRAGAACVVAELDQVSDADADPVDALRAWLGAAQQALERSGFERGCPLGTVALESTPADVEIRAALAHGFGAVRDRLTALLWRAGAAPDRAAGLAAMIVATYEGALMQARVAGTVAPMSHACATLLRLLDEELSTAHTCAVRASRAVSAHRGSGE